MSGTVLQAIVESALLVGLAEVGDKSQLVCVALGARHRPLPVVLGAAAAFAGLNALAVGVGTLLDVVLPGPVLAVLVGGLFLAFGVAALRGPHVHLAGSLPDVGARGGFVAAAGLLFLAELGDKTQITVAALAGTRDPVGVWIGASTALIVLAVLGVLVGQALLRVVPIAWLHRLAGVLFLGLGVVALSGGVWSALG